MNDFTKHFIRILPSLRQSTLEAIEWDNIKGSKMQIPVMDHEVTVYWHKAAKTPAPVLFEMHGGGFALGTAAKDDELCEVIKDQAGIHVVSIDYRKAPEHPYPAAVDDVCGVISHIAANAEQYGAEKDNMAVMGYSAGANLAAVASMMAKERQEFSLRAQILHYPFLDAVKKPDLGKGLDADLPPEVTVAFNDCYCEEEGRTDPYVSPAYADEKRLKGLTPALILTAEQDSLKEDGIRYGQLLEAAGVPVTIRTVRHAHHGYIEDYYNQACYEMTPDETKAAHDPKFGHAAEAAIAESIQFLRDSFK